MYIVTIVYVFVCVVTMYAWRVWRFILKRSHDFLFKK